MNPPYAGTNHSTSEAMHSKVLTQPDFCGEQFQQKILAGQPGTSVNIDTVFHTCDGFQVIELLQDCRAGSANNPHTSHPNNYWDKNWRKFSALWALTVKLEGTLWLVNYSATNDKIRMIRVSEVIPGPAGKLDGTCWNTTFDRFQTDYMERFVNAVKPAWEPVS